MVLQVLGRLQRLPVHRIVVGCQLPALSSSFTLQQPQPPQPIKALQAQCNRTFFTCYRLLQIPNAAKREQLAVSHPRLYKQFERERALDKLSKEWDIIFSQGELKTKITVALWLSFLCLSAIPVIAVYGWMETEHEDSVIFAGVSISKQTEFLMFIAINVLLFRLVYKTVRNVPKRIYFNEAKDKYMAIVPSYVPWSVKSIEFKSADIGELPLKTLSIMKPWRAQEYRVQKRVLFFPLMCFRSGHDRHLMLRHKNLK